jgi:hypothetical protein
MFWVWPMSTKAPPPTSAPTVMTLRREKRMAMVPSSGTEAKPPSAARPMLTLRLVRDQP